MSIRDAARGCGDFLNYLGEISIKNYKLPELGQLYSDFASHNRFIQEFRCIDISIERVEDYCEVLYTWKKLEKEIERNTETTVETINNRFEILDL